MSTASPAVQFVDIHDQIVYTTYGWCAFPHLDHFNTDLLIETLLSKNDKGKPALWKTSEIPLTENGDYCLSDTALMQLEAMFNLSQLLFALYHGDVIQATFRDIQLSRASRDIRTAGFRKLGAETKNVRDVLHSVAWDIIETGCLPVILSIYKNPVLTMVKQKCLDLLTNILNVEKIARYVMREEAWFLKELVHLVAQGDLRSEKVPAVSCLSRIIVAILCLKLKKENQSLINLNYLEAVLSVLENRSLSDGRCRDFCKFETITLQSITMLVQDGQYINWSQENREKLFMYAYQCIVNWKIDLTSEDSSVGSSERHYDALGFSTGGLVFSLIILVHIAKLSAETKRSLAIDGTFELTLLQLWESYGPQAAVGRINSAVMNAIADLHSGLYDKMFLSDMKHSGLSLPPIATLRDKVKRHCSNQLCKKFESKVQEFKVCSDCRLVCYCSNACQKLDWKKGGHKQRCKLLRIGLSGSPKSSEYVGRAREPSDLSDERENVRPEMKKSKDYKKEFEANESIPRLALADITAKQQNPMGETKIVATKPAVKSVVQAVPKLSNTAQSLLDTLETMDVDDVNSTTENTEENTKENLMDADDICSFDDSNNEDLLAVDPAVLCVISANDMAPSYFKNEAKSLFNPQLFGEHVLKNMHHIDAASENGKISNIDKVELVSGDVSGDCHLLSPIPEEDCDSSISESQASDLLDSDDEGMPDVSTRMSSLRLETSHRDASTASQWSVESTYGSDIDQISLNLTSNESNKNKEEVLLDAGSENCKTKLTDETKGCDMQCKVPFEPRKLWNEIFEGNENKCTMEFKKSNEVPLSTYEESDLAKLIKLVESINADQESYEKQAAEHHCSTDTEIEGTYHDKTEESSSYSNNTGRYNLSLRAQTFHESRPRPNMKTVYDLEDEENMDEISWQEPVDDRFMQESAQYDSGSNDDVSSLSPTPVVIGVADSSFMSDEYYSPQNGESKSTETFYDFSLLEDSIGAAANLEYAYDSFESDSDEDDQNVLFYDIDQDSGISQEVSLGQGVPDLMGSGDNEITDSFRRNYHILDNDSSLEAAGNESVQQMDISDCSDLNALIDISAREQESTENNDNENKSHSDENTSGSEKSNDDLRLLDYNYGEDVLQESYEGGNEVTDDKEESQDIPISEIDSFLDVNAPDLDAEFLVGSYEMTGSSDEDVGYPYINSADLLSLSGDESSLSEWSLDLSINNYEDGDDLEEETKSLTEDLQNVLLDTADADYHPEHTCENQESNHSDLGEGDSVVIIPQEDANEACTNTVTDGQSMQRDAESPEDAYTSCLETACFIDGDLEQPTNQAVDQLQRLRPAFDDLHDGEAGDAGECDHTDQQPTSSSSEATSVLKKNGEKSQSGSRKKESKKTIKNYISCTVA